mmetsp:Transcript_9885/g.28114  ORF Transcript_9885/g.28114 Transcript_9885/m.28114 type:complete len:201 (-) Transcript_9885:341-943(-)
MGRLVHSRVVGVVAQVVDGRLRRGRRAAGVHHSGRHFGLGRGLHLVVGPFQGSTFAVRPLQREAGGRRYRCSNAVCCAMLAVARRDVPGGASGNRHHRADFGPASRSTWAGPGCRNAGGARGCRRGVGFGVGGPFRGGFGVGRRHQGLPLRGAQLRVVPEVAAWRQPPGPPPCRPRQDVSRGPQRLGRRRQLVILGGRWP